MPARIVGWGSHLVEWAWLRERGHRLFSSEGLFVAALFGHFAIRIQTITGARLGEVQQIAQNPECIKQLVNVGPKAATRWLLRLIPKGEAIERRDYYIDEDTKNDLMEVIGFLRAKTGTKRSPGGAVPIPQNTARSICIPMGREGARPVRVELRDSFSVARCSHSRC